MASSVDLEWWSFDPSLGTQLDCTTANQFVYVYKRVSMGVGSVPVAVIGFFFRKSRTRKKTPTSWWPLTRWMKNVDCTEKMFLAIVSVVRLLLGCWEESWPCLHLHPYWRSRRSPLSRWPASLSLSSGTLSVHSMRTARSLSGRCTNKSTPTTKPFCSPSISQSCFLDKLQTSITSSFLKLGHFSF